MKYTEVKRILIENSELKEKGIFIEDGKIHYLIESILSCQENRKQILATKASIFIMIVQIIALIVLLTTKN